MFRKKNFTLNFMMKISKYVLKFISFKPHLWTCDMRYMEKGVMAILVEGCIHKKSKYCMIMGPSQKHVFFLIFRVTPLHGH